MRVLLFAVLLSLMSAPGRAATIETGMLAGAGYRIDMPKPWNRGLIVFFHGTWDRMGRFSDSEPLPGFLRTLEDRGYAVIQSTYAEPGWAVEQAIDDSERLRQRFVKTHGKAQQTFAIGMSMGGLLTVQALESRPSVYAGGLSLCGAITPADALFARDFALRAAFDFYFPDLLGALVPVPASFNPSDELKARIEQAMKKNQRAAESIHHLFGVWSEASFADVIASSTSDLRELQQRAKGNPFGNANLVYTGSLDDAALNRGVARYEADAKAAAYLSSWYTPTGKLERPLLAVHTTGDPLVPASSAFDYALIARRAGHEDHFVQQFVDAEGHCTISDDLVVRAFDDLLAWTRGKRPAPGLRH
ncbi:MAG: alpha/beta hydrolase [Xanthomonadales bacterium]|nr:alpha/beta hydrolase [Xanthomonadales bacterium]